METEQTRERYGLISSLTGIILNTILCAAKIASGVISGSISSVADGINNLSDAASSVVALIGFRISSSKPDREHPFGHGRAEYISGFAVSVSILMIGAELIRSSVERIIRPETPSYSAASFVILSVSIAVKLFMALFNRSLGKKISSPTLMAVSADSVGDCMATAVVIISAIIHSLYGITVDGYAGLIVSLFIIFSGIRALKETAAPLLGAPPDKGFLEKIRNIVLKDSSVLGLHDVVCHDYGPGRRMVSLHVEVSKDSVLVDIHDRIDRLEKEIKKELGCETVIHIDPSFRDDSSSMEARRIITDTLSEIDPGITMHDFRKVTGNGENSYVFDIIIPFGLELEDDAVTDMIKKRLESFDRGCSVIITVDRPYTQ